MTKGANQGQAAGHTPGEPPAAGAIDGAPGDQVDAQVDQVDVTGADPDELLTGSPDLAADDLLSVAAELVASPRRARGRPAGATNRKNGDMIAYLAALGHRDPWVTLSLIQTADTEKLAQKLSMKRGEVLGLQLRAADALMPYHHAKKPQQLDLPIGDKRPLMMFGEVNVQLVQGGDGYMSAGVMPGEKVNEINGDAVRQSVDVPHETAKPLKSQDDSGETG